MFDILISMVEERLNARDEAPLFSWCWRRQLFRVRTSLLLNRLILMLLTANCDTSKASTQEKRWGPTASWLYSVFAY